ncbi:hypothetical protein F5Y18DRAFT_366932 [Xylariaceae sp. FL1019]|nr:hypothetical protein F5Y18DRAFT_366932 [Xylariaceae sp. FL1019]
MLTLRHLLFSALTALSLPAVVHGGAPSPTATPERTPDGAAAFITPDPSPPKSVREKKDVHPETPKKYPDVPVLGYVTPWNSRGKQLVEDFRVKFDIISPVWYTIHPDADSTKVYRIEGGPPSEDDVTWYKRLQTPSASASKVVKITPRFILENWNQDDYNNLIFNQTRWDILSSSVWGVVKDMSYDGIVFESSATHAMGGALEPLSTLLHTHGKILTLVMPPLRTAAGHGAQNRVILESIPPLAKITDYFSIMTYDFTGPAGLETDRAFPAGSTMAKSKKHGKVREPGPNTSLEWIKVNMGALSHLLTLDSQSVLGEHFQFSEEITARMLMGMPLYGYTYPVTFADAKTGDVLKKKAKEQKDIVPILVGPGKALTALEAEKLLDEHGSAIQQDSDGEYFFYYVENGVYWRATIPTTESLSSALAVLDQGIDVLKQDPTIQPLKAGVALWEVGQSSLELLDVL